MPADRSSKYDPTYKTKGEEDLVIYYEDAVALDRHARSGAP